MRYAYVIEKTRTGYSAYIPDLPGCIATGRTKPVVAKRLSGAVRMHLNGMREDGQRPPKPSAHVGHVMPAARVLKRRAA